MDATQRASASIHVRSTALGIGGGNNHFTCDSAMALGNDGDQGWAVEVKQRLVAPHTPAPTAKITLLILLCAIASHQPYRHQRTGYEP